MRQIYLSYQLTQIFFCQQQTKVLFCNQKDNTILLKEGKFLVEYNYAQLQETGRANLNFKDAKLGINICYAEEYEIYFILFEGWRLHIFKKQLHLLQQINFDSKYNIGLHFWNESLVMVGVEEIDVIAVEIETNVMTAKFVSSYHFALEQVLVKELESNMNTMDWYMGFSMVDDQLFIWSSQDLSIIHVSKHKVLPSAKLTKKQLKKYNIQSEIVQHYTAITSHENPISQFCFLQVYRYFMLGYQNGEIKVWKINTTVKKSELLVHIFDGHTKQVDSMVVHPNGRLFWSAAQDQNLRLWNLDQFTNIYVITLSGIYSDLRMLNYDLFLLFSENTISIGQINNNLQLLQMVNADVVSYVRKEKDLILTLDNNTSIFVPENLALPFPTLYTPKSMEIKQVVAMQDIYVMLVEGGKIAFKWLENQKGSLIDEIASDHIKDFDGNHILQEIEVIARSKIVIPCYDADFGQAGNLHSPPGSEQLLMGLGKGSVIVICISQPRRMHARMSYHRERIITVAEIDGWLISFCVEGHMKLVSCKEDRIQCIRSLNTSKLVQTLLTIGNKVLLFNARGPFEIFKLKNKQFYLYSYDKGNEHEGVVHSVEYHNKCYFTAGADSKIKVWSSRKILLLQLNIDGPLGGAWLMGSQLVIAHSGKLSRIEQSKCKFHHLRPKEANRLHKEPLTTVLEDYYAIHSKREVRQSQQEFRQAPKLTPQKPVFKPKQRSPQVSYVGGKVYFEENQQVIIYRGREFQTELQNESVEQVPKKSQSKPRPERLDVDIQQELNALREYEKQRRNRFQPIRALPKIPVLSVQPTAQKIVTRRDLTIQKITMQYLLQ